MVPALRPGLDQHALDDGGSTAEPDPTASDRLRPFSLRSTERRQDGWSRARTEASPYRALHGAWIPLIAPDPRWKFPEVIAGRSYPENRLHHALLYKYTYTCICYSFSPLISLDYFRLNRPIGNQHHTASGLDPAYSPIIDTRLGDGWRATGRNRFPYQTRQQHVKKYNERSAMSFYHAIIIY